MCVVDVSVNIYVCFVNNMRLLRCVLLWTATAAAVAASTLFNDDAYAGDLSPAAADAHEKQLKYNVLPKFSADKSLVLAAKKAELDCTALNQKGNLSEISLPWQGEQLTAVKKLYQYYPQFQGRHSWTGELAGKQTGTVSVVWTDACDPAMFHMSVVLNDNESKNKIALKTVACTGKDDLPGCTWIVQVQSPARDELEHPHVNHRALNIVANSTEAALDAHIERELRRKKKSKSNRPAVANTSAIVETAGDPNNVLKVLWIYTPKTRDLWGDAKIRSMIVAGISTANLAMTNSKIDLTIQCVGITCAEGYFTNNHQQSLDDLANNRVPKAFAKRDLYKADLVQMVIHDPQWCGLGYVMGQPSVSFAPYGFSTVHTDCFSTYSHCHELMHNMGANHDAESAGGVVPGTSNYGHRYCNEPSAYRSVMAYSCSGSTRVPYISDPNIWYMGRKTGTAQANNAETIRRNKAYITNFRQG